MHRRLSLGGRERGEERARERKEKRARRAGEERERTGGLSPGGRIGILTAEIQNFASRVWTAELELNSAPRAQSGRDREREERRERERERERASERERESVRESDREIER